MIKYVYWFVFSKMKQLKFNHILIILLKLFKFTVFNSDRCVHNWPLKRINFLKIDCNQFSKMKTKALYYLIKCDDIKFENYC